jgi:hypothetical protein
MHSGLFAHGSATDTADKSTNESLLSLAESLKNRMKNESPRRDGNSTPGVANEQTSSTTSSITKQNQSPEFPTMLTKYHQAGAQLTGSAFPLRDSKQIETNIRPTAFQSVSRDILAYSHSEVPPLATKYHQAAAEMHPLALFQPNMSTPLALGGITIPGFKMDTALATKYHQAAAQMAATFTQNKTQDDNTKPTEPDSALATKYHQAGVQLMNTTALLPQSTPDKSQAMSSDSSSESDLSISASFSLADVQPATTKYHQAAAQIMGSAFPQRELQAQEKIPSSSPGDVSLATKYHEAGAQLMNTIFPENEMRDLNANPTQGMNQQLPLTYSTAGLQQMTAKYQQAGLMNPVFPQAHSPDVNRNSTTSQPCDQQAFSQSQVGELQQ